MALLFKVFQVFRFLLRFRLVPRPSLPMDGNCQAIQRVLGVKSEGPELFRSPRDTQGQLTALGAATATTLFPVLQTSNESGVIFFRGEAEGLVQSRAGLTRDPLNPDHIISPRWGCEFLQAVAVVVFHLVPINLQVVLGFEEERFHHVHQLHAVENRQQDMLADPSYSSAAIQGTVRPSSPGPLRKGTDTHCESWTLQLPRQLDFIWVNFM